MCRSMVDIHSATAEIRRGQKKERKEKEKRNRTNIMSASATQGGHKNYTLESICRDGLQDSMYKAKDKASGLPGQDQGQ